MNTTVEHKAVVVAALDAVGVTASDDQSLSPAQARLQKAADLYLTDAQLNTLTAAGQRGWKGRSIVTDVKTRQAAVSITRGTAVAWVMPDGRVEGEEFLVKGMLH